MSIISSLANRLVLCPSTNPIDPGDKERIEIPVAGGHVEAWVGRHCETSVGDSRELTILKFPGTAGRAERAGVHPAELWPNMAAELWAVNQLGYGGSSQPASIQSFPATANAIYQFLSDRNPSRPIVVVGNSLGCVPALYVSAQFDIEAMLLRNPPPLHQMIRTRPRYSWWNFGLSRWIADQIPSELDSLENAKNSSTRCLFVQSEKDTVVPVKFQSKIVENFSGEKKVFQIQGANHADMVAEDQYEEYKAAIRWLVEAFD